MKTTRSWEWLDALLPAVDREEPYRLQRGRLLAGLMLMAALPLPLFIASYAAMGQVEMTLSSALFFTLFASLLLIYKRAGLVVVTQLLLVLGTAAITVSTALTGGLFSFVAPFMTVVPMMAMTMIGRRWGLLWGAVSLLWVLVWLLIDLAGWTPEPRLVVSNANITVAMNLLTLTAYAGGVVAFLLGLNRLRLEEVHEQRARAEEASRTKSAFLANMSHELRTPLNGILGLTEAIQQAGRLSPEDAASLDMVLRSGHGLAQILDDLLDFSKLEADRVELEQIPVLLPELITDVLGLFSDRASQRRVTLESDCAPDVDWGMGDPSRLRQVLLNLVGNAVKFTSDGAVRVRARREGDLVVVDVQDNGVGISEAQQARLFEPFVQADSSITRRFGGSGLGLSICRRLVDLMGGQITLESTPGIGSTFTFSVRFPACAPQARSTRQDTLRLPPGLRVLVAEDNLINQHVIRQLLEPLGAEVLIAGDGASALEQLRASDPDVVLMDIHMPVMDGLEATRQARRLQSSVPIIALSASTFQEDRQAAAAAGADDFLSKPVSRQTLCAAIIRAIAPTAHTAQQ